MAPRGPPTDGRRKVVKTKIIEAHSMRVLARGYQEELQVARGIPSCHHGAVGPRKNRADWAAAAPSHLLRQPHE